MKKGKILITMIVCMFVASMLPGIYAEIPTNGNVNYKPDEIVVKFKQGLSEQNVNTIAAAHGLSVLSKSRYTGVHRMRIPNGQTVFEVAYRLNKNPNVEYAEPNYIYTACMIPNDTFYNIYQWNFQDISQGGINMSQAWDMTNGTGAVVAIVDSGISRAGQDLVNTNFVPGYDFVNNDNDPTDDNGHGTHCAGTVAQSTNNNIGCAGIAFGASLMPVKVLNRRGSGYQTDIADGIYYAADNGANVISMSLGGSVGSQTLLDAVNYAYDANVTVVAASGNEGGPVSYPAYYPNVIAVGATRYDTQVTDYSNHGPQLDVVAPGGDTSVDQNGDAYGDGILQETFQRNSWGYYFFEGTSMATPHVSGVAALLYSYGVTTPDEIRTALQQTAVDLGADGWDEYYGYGLIDAYAALNYYGGGPINTAPTVTITNPAEGTTVSDMVTITVYAIDTEDGSLTPDIYIDGTWVATATSFNWDTTAYNDGSHTIYAEATDSGGKKGSDQISVTVDNIQENNPPTITITNPAEGAAVSGMVTITVEAIDTEDGFLTPDIYIDGTWIATATSFNWDTTAYNDGSHTIYAEATDSSFETGLDEITVTVNNGGSGLNDMWVSDISWRTKQAGPNLFIYHTVTVMSDDGPVSSATVYSTLALDGGGSWDFSGVTDSNGKIEFSLKGPSHGKYTATVTLITHATYTYNQTKDLDNPDSTTI